MIEKILNAIKESIESNGYECAIDYQRADMGIIRCIENSFDIKLNINFDFRNDDVMFQFYPGNKKPVRTRMFTHKDCILDTSFNLNNNLKQEIDELLIFISNYLMG